MAISRILERSGDTMLQSMEGDVLRVIHALDGESDGREKQLRYIQEYLVGTGSGPPGEAGEMAWGGGAAIQVGMKKRGVQYKESSAHPTPRFPLILQKISGKLHYYSEDCV
jgi:hypothetical protein